MNFWQNSKLSCEALFKRSGSPSCAHMSADRVGSKPGLRGVTAEDIKGSYRTVVITIEGNNLVWVEA